ncbi:unnamed protein product [Meganyctiphanes norvegica]|uniref:Uncharacterized protein n=1 Tax=Meganyctiphanes norvegica TaxID=48144 RepID=A0AAV2SS46_MEGNR
MALNGGYALASLSEEGLEATNKFIRHFLELLSRQTSADQMTDVIISLLERSHSFITSSTCLFKKMERNIIFLYCNSNDHSMFQHHKRIQFGPKIQYDSLVDSMIIDIK